MASIRDAMHFLRKNGLVESWRKYREPGQYVSLFRKDVFTVLLLTNRDSDNVGDQVIEACDISLVATVMKNLGVKRFRINSRAAGIVPKKYLTTHDDELLTAARAAIQKADVVVFGGAPLFNYRYQPFYERTAITLELAQEYGKPVIFSAIGVEGYDEDNEKCQRLKKTLNLDCVKQITTRDDLDSLRHFIESDRIPVSKVSDPAVFTEKVFEKFANPVKKRKIGIFVIRANAFIDNGVQFTRDQAAELWLDLINELEEREYNYDLLTSGHFGDEAFLDSLIKTHNVNAKKCIFNMNSPEKLIEKISSYDAVVSCRLHPSIISYSLGVPALGIVWNSKVDFFYDAIGYPDRIITTQGISGKVLADRLEQIIDQGVSKDADYLMTVYTSLFNGLKAVMQPDSQTAPYTYDELQRNLVPFRGTSLLEMNSKVKRKFRRTYGKYNDLSALNHEQKETIQELEAKVKELKKQIKKLEQK